MGRAASHHTRQALGTHPEDGHAPGVQPSRPITASLLKALGVYREFGVHMLRVHPLEEVGSQASAGNLGGSQNLLCCE